jgi:folliculin-interacting protein 2
LTAVLTHHLGWIGTVAPLMTSNMRDSLLKNGNANPFISKLIEEENFKLSEISKAYPYNALWAQLGDLYGAIASPIKLSKTIICGSEGNVQIIERLLNILTYFIRCSEIRRNSHTKVFDKDELNKTVNHQLNQRKTIKSLTPMNSNCSSNSSFRNLKKASGLTRTQTNVKDLSKAFDQDELSERHTSDFSDLDPETCQLLLKILKKNVMNDIPKVLAFRDSRFVKQELRIGNKSMDTGIEMPAKDREFLSRYQKNIPVTGEHIKFTVTRPDDIEETIELDDENDLRSRLGNYISLSNLITANSLGGAQNVMKLFWEKDQFNEAINLEQIKHLERLSAKHQMPEETEKLRPILESNSIESVDRSVVFVLGDDEQLVGLKTSLSMQTIYCDDDAQASTSKKTTKKKACRHNKIHSGVKFNFEKYPQIATNYMRSKHLEFSEFEVLEKGLKLEREGTCSNQLRSEFPSNQTLRSQDDSDSEEECEYCKNGNEIHYLTTPSNATELEFSSAQSNESYFLSPTAKITFNEPPAALAAHFQMLQTLDEDKELNSKKNNDDDVKMVEIPMLESIKAPSVQDEILRPGFTSSLFTSTSDHYIADMILQVIIIWKFIAIKNVNFLLFSITGNNVTTIQMGTSIETRSNDIFALCCFRAIAS